MNNLRCPFFFSFDRLIIAQCRRRYYLGGPLSFKSVRITTTWYGFQVDNV